MPFCEGKSKIAGRFRNAAAYGRIGARDKDDSHRLRFASLTGATAQGRLQLSKTDAAAALLVGAPLILSFIQVYAVVRDVHITLADVGYLGLVLGAAVLQATGHSRTRAAPLAIPFALILLTTIAAVILAEPPTGLRGVREVVQEVRDITCFYAVLAVIAGRPYSARILGLAFLSVAVAFAIAGTASAVASALEPNRVLGTYQRPELLLGTGFPQFMWPAAIMVLAELTFSRNRLFRLVLVAALVALVAALVIGYGRGALATIAIGAVIFLLIGQHRRPLVIGLGLAGIVVVALLFAVPNIRYALTARLTTLDLSGERFGPTTDGTGTSALRPYNSEYTRLVLWRAGLAMITKSPIIGHGPGNFPTEVAKFLPNDTPIPPEVGRLGDVDNQFLQIAIDTGLLGLTAYLSLVVSCIVCAVRVLKVRNRLGAWAVPALAGAVFVLLWPLTDLYVIFVGGYVIRAFFIALPFAAIAAHRSQGGAQAGDAESRARL
jgi:O-antigen ligase